MDNLAQIEQQLHSPNRTVRYRAIYRLSGLDTPESIQLLMEALAADEDREIRAIAGKLLSRKSALNVTSALVKALREDRHAEVRRAVAESLGSMEAVDDIAVTGLIEALYDRSKLVRRAAVQSIRVIGDSSAVPGLIGVLLGDPDSFVRWEAAQTLEIFADGQAINALIEALSADENSYVRYASASALGAIGDDVVIEPLKTAFLNDVNSYVRFSAGQSLGQFLIDKARYDLVPTFVMALQDKNTHVWHVAAESLWGAGEAVIPHVMRCLVAEDTTMRRSALKAVLWLTAEYDKDEMLSLVDDMEVVNWGWWN